MKEKGDLFHNPKAPETESLGPQFWASAQIEEPRKPRSVHLKIDNDVFDYFYAETKGKGHLTRMQNVLKAYVNSQRNQ